MIRVMSYNVRFDNPGDGADSWAHRRTRVAHVIRTGDPDLLGVQESLLGQIRDLEAELPGYSWIGVGREGGDRGEFCAILFKTSRVRILEHGTFWLSSSPDEVGSIGWDASLPRIATWALVRDVRSGSTSFAVNTHVDHKGRRAQIESARMLVREVDDRSGARPTVVMGDFNFEDDSEPYRILTSAWQDTYRTAREGHQGPDATFVQDRRAGGIASGRRLDYIFVRGASTRRHRILPDSWQGRIPSDHLPVVADVELAPVVR